MNEFWFPCIRQRNADDCGAAALATVARQCGATITLPHLRALMGKAGAGASLLGIVQAATSIGFEARGLRVQHPRALTKIRLPFIAHMISEGQGHFVVVQKLDNHGVRIADPATGRRRSTLDVFATQFTGCLVELKKTTRVHDAEQHASPMRFIGGELNAIDHLIGLLALVSILITVCGLTLSLFTRMLTAVGQHPESTGNTGIILGQMVALLLIRASVSVGRGWLITTISENVSLRLMNKFCRSLLRMPHQLYSIYSPGELADQMVDVLRVRDGINLATSSLLIDISTILVTCLMLSLFAPAVACMVAAVMMVCGVLLFLMQPRHALLQSATLGALSRLQGYVADGLEHIWSIKGCHLEEHWLVRADQSVDTFLHSGRRLMRWGMCTAAVQDVAAGFIIAGTAAICLLGVKHQTIAPLNVVMIYTLALFAVTPFSRVSLSMLQLQEGLSSLERLSGTLLTIERDKPLPALEEAEEGRAAEYHIAMRDVSFAFRGQQALLDKLNLTVEHGEKVALTGTSGSGKTTLLKLLGGLETPTKGTVRIDASRSARKAVYLDHRPYLVSGTIQENITFGQHVSIVDLNQAVEASGLGSLITKRGWNHLVERDGVGFSAGERQRIVLARALLAQKGLLLLDESLDSLDVQAATTVMQRLYLLYPGVTIIVITHRMQTIPTGFRKIDLAGGAVYEDVHMVA